MLYGIVLLAGVTMLGSTNPDGTTMPSPQAVVDAAAYINPALGDCGIQQAVDAAAAKGGGVVQLPAGRFVMERYLYLRSGVTVKGQGDRTVLTVGKGETLADIAADVPAGATEIPLTEEPSGLAPGMVVFLWPDEDAYHQGRVPYLKVSAVDGKTIVLDKPVEHEIHRDRSPWASWGLHTYLTKPASIGEHRITVAQPALLKPGYAVWMTGRGDQWGHHFNVVVAIDGDTVTLDRALTIDAKADSLVQHGFAMLTADGEKGIGVSDLVIEGWGGKRLPRWVGLDFCLSGIHTVRCDDITVSNVGIRRWHSDGVSIQRGKNAVIDHSSVIDCRGRGFHPGTTFDSAEFTNLRSVGNGLDGFYYCYNNTNVNLRNSLIKGNHGHGIGGLGDPGDRRAIIENNVIEDNGLSGIEINGGGDDSGTVIRDNIIRDNSRLKAGEWAGIAIYPTGEPAAGYVIEGNSFESTLAEPTQLVGVEERNGDPVRAEVFTGGRRTVDRIADHNVIRNNKYSGLPTDVIVVGPATQVTEGEGVKVVRKAAAPAKEAQ
jgi:hypothetical protein